MITNYYVVIDGKATGPYTASQLAQIGIKGNNLIWYQGISNWIPASTVPEVMEALNSISTEITESQIQTEEPVNDGTTTEPMFNQPEPEQQPEATEPENITVSPAEMTNDTIIAENEMHETQTPMEPVMPTVQYKTQEQPAITGYTEELQPDQCPPQHLGLAIFAAIMFPTGIAAVVKTALIKVRWNQGRYDDAIWLAQSARKFSIISIVLGAIFWTLYLMLIISANTL